MIRINAPELARFKRRADVADKRIVSRLRKGLRDIGSGAVAASKAAVLQDPPNDRPGSAGSRAAVAAGIRMVVSFSERGGGVRITATNSALSKEHKGFVAAYEKRSLRHPVYGNRSVSVGQSTRPYFGSVIRSNFDKSAEKEMEAVFNEAVKAIGGRLR